MPVRLTPGMSGTTTLVSTVYFTSLWVQVAADAADAKAMMVRMETVFMLVDGDMEAMLFVGEVCEL